MLVATILIIVTIKAAAETDASLEYSIELDRSTIRLGQHARIFMHYRNIGDLPIKTYGPLVDFPTRFRNCLAPVPSLIPRTWETLEPGVAKYWIWAVPLGHVVDDVMIGQHEFVIRLGHTSGDQWWTIERTVVLTIEPTNMEDYAGFEEYWVDRIACDSWDRNRKVQLRYFDLREARWDLQCPDRQYEKRKWDCSLPQEEYGKVYYSDRYQQFLRLEALHNGVYRRSPYELIRSLEYALGESRAYREDPGNWFLFDLPWAIENTNEAGPKIDYAVYMARFEGVAPSRAHLEALANDPLPSFDAALVSDLLRVFQRSDRLDESPNTSVAADRDPRERGFRPMNNNR
jgi:hypothetical protein